MSLPSILCLMGPTASGKTQLAIDLLTVLPCEIISVDSAMVYRGMDIGTAKPQADILSIAPHHLIDIRDPRDAYSAADFCQDAMQLIHDIIARQKIPLLVGGTMLYFRALQQGLSDLPSADSAVRDKILNEALELGWDALHERLALVDPEASLRIHKHDTQRIQRALEVFEMTGRSLTELQRMGKENVLSYPFVNIAVSPADRAVLHDRIAKRFTQMMQLGFLTEVQHLMQRTDLNNDMPSMRAVGYRQAWSYLEGEYGLCELHEKAVAATRQLAKRQLTWLRHWKSPIQFFESEATDLLPQVLAYLDVQGIK